VTGVLSRRSVLSRQDDPVADDLDALHGQGHAAAETAGEQGGQFIGLRRHGFGRQRQAAHLGARGDEADHRPAARPKFAGDLDVRGALPVEDSSPDNHAVGRLKEDLDGLHALPGQEHFGVGVGGEIGVEVLLGQLQAPGAQWRGRSGLGLCRRGRSGGRGGEGFGRRGGTRQFGPQGVQMGLRLPGLLGRVGGDDGRRDRAGTDAAHQQGGGQPEGAGHDQEGEQATPAAGSRGRFGGPVRWGRHVSLLRGHAVRPPSPGQWCSAKMRRSIISSSAGTITMT